MEPNPHSKPCQSDSPHWKGHGEISGAFWFRNLRNNANKRGWKIEISIEWAWEQFLRQDRKCALTGWPLCFSRHFGKQTASLDRIDSNKHYTEDNVRWLHKDVNRMKMNYTDEQFIEMCKSVINYYCGEAKE